MVCMNDYRHQDYKCDYKPCGHTGKKHLHKYDFGKTEFCPKCKLFTYKPFIDWCISDEIIEKSKELTEEKQ